MERTQACKKCGEVKFRIESYVEEYKAICINCNNVVAEVSLDKYQAVIPRCPKCNSEVFKARVTQDDRSEYWILKCSECDCKAELKYYDYEGNEIDRKTRELLIIKDSIIQLEHKVDGLENDISNLEYKINTIDSSIDTHDYELKALEGDISEVKSDIFNLECKVRDIDI